MKKPSNSNENDPLNIVGKHGARVDSRDKITGRAVYTDDMCLPAMLFGKLKRSPVAHATIDRIDVARALATDGVRAIITGADLPQKYGILPVSQDETALAVDRVRYVGEPVAAVCADNEAAAQSALDLIDVSYTPMQTVMSVSDAARASVRVHDSEKFDGNAHRVIALEFGDAEAAIDDAEYSREDKFFYAGSTHVPMESHSTLADYDGRRLTLYVSHQAPYYLQRILPGVLSLDSQDLRVVVPYVGGGFGGKLEPFPDSICAAKLSMITGRPVKITLEREEVFYNHRGRHASLMWIRTGVSHGRVAGLYFKAFIDGGAYGSFGTAAAYYHGALQPTTYRIPNYKVEIVRFYTNKPACGPKRGHGTPQPRFALECHFDKIADDLGTDPAAFRRTNLIKPQSTTVNHLRITSCGLDRCVREVIGASRYTEQRGALPRGEGIGFAVGCYLSGAALPIYWNEMPHSEVLIKADRSGTVTAYSGHTEIGQGSDTVLAYITAECLGLQPRDVALVLRDSDAVPPDLGSYSSRVTYMMGNAAREAAEKLRDVLRDAAAEALDTAADDLRFENRTIRSRTSAGKSIAFEDAVARAEAKYGALSFSGKYTPAVVFGDYKGAGVGPSPAYSYTACVIRLSVDPETGLIAPRTVWIAHDIGRCINRKNVEGQIEGGVYMGLGEAMMEEMVYTKDGLLRNAGLLDYKTPTTMETPDIRIHLVEDADSGGPFGAKEVGQGPLLPVLPAFANAVHDAIGVRFDEIPITPDKVIKAIGAGRTRVGPARVPGFVFPEPIRAEVPADATT